MLTELFPKEGIGGGARGSHDSSLMDKNLLTRGQENYWNWGEGYYWTWFVSDGSKGPVFSHGARVGVKYNLLSERGYFIWRMRIETGIFVNF